MFGKIILLIQIFISINYKDGEPTLRRHFAVASDIRLQGQTKGSLQ